MLLYIFKSIKDGKLHKGLNYGDSSYVFGKKKKRGLLSDKSDYYGLPYTIHRKNFGSNWFMDEKNLNKDQGICRYAFKFRIEFNKIKFIAKTMLYTVKIRFTEYTLSYL